MTKVNLVSAVVGILQEAIQSGRYPPGGKLPTEPQLMEELGVSRTVLREAVAALRLGGQLIARHGSGIYVAQKDVEGAGFVLDDTTTMRRAYQVLELRLGVESEAVMLAAERRRPAQLAAIAEALDHFSALDGSDSAAFAAADFNFHLAVARATNNPQFARFLESLGEDIIVDLGLKFTGRVPEGDVRKYLKRISGEHSDIVAAISRQDARKARAALRRHLVTSRDRYRALDNSRAG